MIFGKNGLVEKSKMAAENYQVASNDEKGYMQNIEEVINNKADINKESNGQDDDSEPMPEGPTISDMVKIGDYVNYNPTYANADGTTLVDSNLLTYTSLKGTASDGGNGYGNQIFTAKDTIKWRVFNIDETNKTVQLLPTNAVKTDASSDFYLRGAIGYLYAEEELHKISGIYGHGYGAKTKMITTYQVGGQLDTITKTITGTGARSLTVEDVNKVAGLAESDLSIFDSLYGSTNPNTQPTYVTYRAGDGISNETVTGLIHHYYTYDKSVVTNEILRSEIFINQNSLLASRMLQLRNKIAYYCIFSSMGSTIGPSTGVAIFIGDKRRVDCWDSNNFGTIFPVVTIKSNMQVEKAADGSWNLK